MAKKGFFTDVKFAVDLGPVGMVDLPESGQPSAISGVELLKSLVKNMASWCFGRQRRYQGKK
jgi:hypothetical protein